MADAPFFYVLPHHYPGDNGTCYHSHGGVEYFELLIQLFENNLPSVRCANMSLSQMIFSQPFIPFFRNGYDQGIFTNHI